MKKDLYLGKHLSLHYTFLNKEMFEFDLLPIITINDWRVMVGLFFFKLQITFKARKDD